MEIVLDILIGVGLAATCGFRVFVPFFVLGIAGLSGYLDLGQGFQWVGTWPAVLAFGVATLIEILAYFFPFVDNLLKTASVPIGVVAGVLAAAAVITDVHPLLQWSMALIAGGGAAAATGIASSGLHYGVTAASAGTASPAVSTAESAGSVVTAVLAVVIPVVTAFLLVLAVVLVVRHRRRARGTG